MKKSYMPQTEQTYIIIKKADNNKLIVKMSDDLKQDKELLTKILLSTLKYYEV